MADHTLTIKIETPEAKYGARTNSADQAHLDAAIGHLVDLGARHPKLNMEPGSSEQADDGNIGNEWVPDKSLINFGFEVKALGDGRIGGYAVRWGSEKEPDLSRAKDWFHEKTYFGANAGNGVDVTMNHGIPLKDTKNPDEAKVWDEIAQHLLPPVKTKIDKIGLFAETVTNLADEYDKMVYALAEKGKLRWSTGAVGHLVKRTAMPNGTNRIDQWIIGEIALTPTPAEPRLGNVLPLKAYVDSLQPAEQPAPNGAQEHSTANYYSQLFSRK